jgi:hypothetical protein
MQVYPKGNIPISFWFRSFNKEDFKSLQASYYFGKVIVTGKYFEDIRFRIKPNNLCKIKYPRKVSRIYSYCED